MDDIESSNENIDILLDNINPYTHELPSSIIPVSNENIITDPSYFQFELNPDKKSYMISAKNKNELPSMISLPKEYEGLPVTKIKDNGFSECINLSIVMFENKSSIKAIGSFAFYGCSELESIEFPRSIKSIKHGAFHACSKLQQVFLHSKIPPELDETSFYKTSPYLSFYVPSKSVKLYGDCESWEDYKKYIFSLPCNIPSNLGFFRFVLNDDGRSYTVYAKDPKVVPSNLIIPSDYSRKPITIIGASAFVRAPIQTLILPKRLVIIGIEAFGWRHQLKELKIPDSVERIEQFAFGVSVTRMKPDFVWSNSILKRVIFGENSKLQYIGETAFWGNMLLKEFFIPKSVKYIGRLSFGSTGLSHIYIPKSVETIGIDPFAQCVYLKDIKVNRNNRYYKDIDGVLYNKDDTELVWYPLAKEDAIYSIPDTVKSISGYYQLWGCVNIRILYLNSPQSPSLYSTFDTALSAFKIYVPADAYEEYKNAPGWSRSEVQSRIYPDNIIKNGFAIENNTLIQYVGDETEITIPENISEIKNYALTSCVNLKNIYVAQNNTNFKSFNGVLFTADLTRLICFPPARTEEEYEIPEDVNIVGFASFLGCQNLIRIKTHKSLEVIEANAFYRCRNLRELTNIDAEDNIKSIGAGTFFECSSIKKIELMSIEIIGSGAFSLCYNVIEITLGSQIKNIAPLTFYTPNAPIKLSIFNILAVVPPVLMGIWIDTPISINVPPQSVDLYKAATGWSNYKDMIYPLVKKVME